MTVPVEGVEAARPAVVEAHHVQTLTPTFALVLATVGRVAEVDAFLTSLANQTYQNFDVIVVDQNGDDRLAAVVRRQGARLRMQWIRSPIGLSRARNAGLEHCDADVIGFPDDDCTYPPDTLSLLARVFARDRTLGGVTVLPRNSDGRPFPRFDLTPGVVSRHNVLNRCTSISLFLRRSVVQEIGRFNEDLGLGSGTLWGSGEDIDYPLRALRAGHRLEYRPEIHVAHPFAITGTAAAASRRGYSYGAGLGWLLRRHRFPAHVAIKYIFVRPLGGLLLGVLRGRWTEARFYAGAIRGRLRGWLSA